MAIWAAIRAHSSSISTHLPHSQSFPICSGKDPPLFLRLFVCVADFQYQKKNKKSRKATEINYAQFLILFAYEQSFLLNYGSKKIPSTYSFNLDVGWKVKDFNSIHAPLTHNQICNLIKFNNVMHVRILYKLRLINK